MIVVKVPLRISFFSGGTDLPAFYRHETGAALSATISQYIYVSLHEVPYGGVRMMYDTVEDVQDIDQMQHAICRETLKYFGLNDRIVVSSVSDIPGQGSGLGSSSVFTVGLINASLLATSYGYETNNKKQLAELACIIEMDKCGFPIGMQDQYAAAYGGFNLFEFQHVSKGKAKVVQDSLDLQPTTLQKLQDNLLLLYTGRSRSSHSILQQHSDAVADKKKLELMRNGRDYAYIGRQYLEKGDVASFCHLFHQAWMEKKQTVADVSNDYFDDIYSKATRSGAIGGKMLGAGGGGFMLFAVEPNRRARLIAELALMAPQCIPYDFKFDPLGSRVLLQD